MTAANKKLISAEHDFVDSTHVKASANKRKFEKKMFVKKHERIKDVFKKKSIKINRENHGKKPFPPDKFDKEETKGIKESTTDSEGGYYVKDERTKRFAYSSHAAADRNGFVLGTIVTPGNTHESLILEPLVEQVIEKVGKPEAVAADAAYKTPAITSYLFNKEIIPALPYTRPRTKEGFFRKQYYVYDEHFDCYLWPSGETYRKQRLSKSGDPAYLANKCGRSRSSASSSRCKTYICKT
ncbi:transposase [Peribacillus frigoritolerans]|nr:transposase [Peribacillus frigoritolerans]